MAAVKTKLGRIACPCCGHSILLKENEAGTLTIQCDECDVSAFAKRGTASAAAWRAALPQIAPESVPKATRQQAPEKQPAPVPEPVPAPVRATPFDPLQFLKKA